MLFYEMKENSIIFLNLNDIRLGSIIQDNDSPISDLTSAFRIKRRTIKNQDPLSGNSEVLEQFHGIGLQCLIPDECCRRNSLQIVCPIYSLLEHIFGSCT